MHLSAKMVLIAVLILSAITLYGIQSPTNHSRKLTDLEAQISTLNLTYNKIDNAYNYYGELSLNNNGPSNITLTDLNVHLQAFDDIVNTTLNISGEVHLSPGASENIEIPMGQPFRAQGYRGNYIENASKKWNFEITIGVSGNAHTLTYDGPFEHSDTQKPYPNIPDNASSPVYLGALDNYHGPDWSYWTYQPTFRGVLGVGRIPIARISSGGVSALYFANVEACTLTVNGPSGARTYYLADSASPFTPDVWALQHYGVGDVVHVYGDVLNYRGSDGGFYQILRPTGVSYEDRGDPVESASQYIASRVGEEYFHKYFTRPEAINGVLQSMVDFYYNMSVGNYSVTCEVSINLNANFSVVDSDGVPPLDNLQPFNVTREQAIGIAFRAGVPRSSFDYAGIVFENGESVKELGSGGRYVWAVSAFFGPSGDVESVARIAFIDPIDGKVYAVVDWITLRVGE